MAKTKRHPKGKGCWYFITWRCCVLCARSEEMRERRYDKRPDNPSQRHEYVEFACGSHFL